MRRQRGEGTLAQQKNGKCTAFARTHVTQFRGLVIGMMVLGAVREGARHIIIYVDSVSLVGIKQIFI